MKAALSPAIETKPARKFIFLESDLSAFGLLRMRRLKEYLNVVNETRKYEVWSRETSIMPGIRQLLTFLARRDRRLCLGPGLGKISFTRADGSSLSSKSIEEVAPLLENMSAPVRWELVGSAPTSNERDTSDSLRIFIDQDYTGALISVNSADIDLADAVFLQIERSFGFERLPPGINRIRWAPHATALIGCHFDEAGKAAAQRLQRFLSLIGFARVDIADTVRVGPIQDKIRDLLDKNSFYIGIVTGQRDHAWISSESGYALSARKEVVLILQSGVKFDKTLVGNDLEHLTFVNTIDEAFIGLLQDFRSRGVLGLT